MARTGWLTPIRPAAHRPTIPPPFRHSAPTWTAFAAHRLGHDRIVDRQSLDEGPHGVRVHGVVPCHRRGHPSTRSAWSVPFFMRSLWHQDHRPEPPARRKPPSCSTLMARAPVHAGRIRYLQCERKLLHCRAQDTALVRIANRDRRGSVRNLHDEQPFLLVVGVQRGVAVEFLTISVREHAISH